MLACEAPLTPDQGEAHEWLVKELARGEYSDAPNPVVRFVASIIDWLTDAVSWRGHGVPPISLVLIILAIIAIAGIVIALIFNPIRLSSRRVSHTVFEEEIGLPEARGAFDQAVAAQDWNLAYVWAYRLMVLGLDECEVVSSTPGLTAREAADAATRLIPDLGPQLALYAQTFDRVRYGGSPASRDQVDTLHDFTPHLLHECRHAGEQS